MSKKQEVRDYLSHTFFHKIDTLDGSLPIYEEACRHKRELEYYITRSLNLKGHIFDAVQYLNPSLYSMLNIQTEQNISKYESNPHDDRCVKSAMAFKMLVGE
mgnify:CR=1 FL=1|jgi:hypothetical protein